MKLKTPHILTLLVLFLLTLYLLLRFGAREPQQIVVISETTVCEQQQSPTYFGAATILPPAFPVFGIPTRPLRELGGWRVNYGL